MAVRMPRDIAKQARGGTPAGNLSPFEVEALSESASSLGYQGRKVEEALAKLKAASDDRREKTANDAAEAVWAYFVQRELCGLRDHRLIIREMNIPRWLLNRLGAASGKKS